MQQPPQHHHFCRWLLPEGHSPEQARAAAFPGLSAVETAAALDAMCPRQLRVSCVRRGGGAGPGAGAVPAQVGVPPPDLVLATASTTTVAG